MKNVIQTLLILGFGLLTTPCFADHEADVHLAAHAGTSFVIDTVAYGVNKRLNVPYPKTCAFVETMLIGLAYKMGERGRVDYQTPMLENAVGASAATLTIIAFDF